MTTDHEKNAVIAEALGWRLKESDLPPRNREAIKRVWWIRPVYKTTHAHPPDYHLDLAAIVDAAHELHFTWSINDISLDRSVLSACGETYGAFELTSSSLALVLRNAVYDVLMERKAE